MVVLLCAAFLRHARRLKRMEAVLRRKLPSGAFPKIAPDRSRIMSAVRGKGNRTTEVRLRMALVRAGISGWVLHPSDQFGRPDFFFGAADVAVFVDGCFWHGCPRCGHVPTSNREFWKLKLSRNKQRDRRVNTVLRRSGRVVLRFWEHEVHSDLGACAGKVAVTLAKRLDGSLVVPDCPSETGKHSYVTCDVT
jgi:DNA mismatch endonuclease, patch repair protein